MMNFDEFCKWGKDAITNNPPAGFERAEARVTTVEKIGRIYNSIGLYTDQKSCSPVANLDELYESYTSGCSLEWIYSRICDIVYKEPPEFVRNIEWVTNYELAKSALFVRLSNEQYNKDYLAKTPYKRVAEGLAMTAHILISSEYGSVANAPVNYSVLDLYGISEEQLFLDALENSEKVFQPVTKPLSAFVGFPYQDPEIKMRVVTNKQSINGASAIMYPSVRRQLSEDFDGDFFIIPSSIHEVITMPVDVSAINKLSGLIRQMNNSNMVEPGEVLSDNLFLYNAKADVIKEVSEYN